MRKNIFNTLIIILITAFLWSCCEKTTAPITIAISKTNDNYSSWVERNGDNATWINLYGLSVDSALIVLNNCDGLLVTGGEDVYPDYYGKISDTSGCGAFDLYRDSLELASIEYAIGTKMPVFGVCRGLQILNIALGGTLIVDIPTNFDTSVIHRQDDWQNCYHEVNVDTTSYIFTLGNVRSSTVNSNHHQGIENLGNGLLITSYTKDSLPESIEWIDKERDGFLLAVQWHPERMEPMHPLSKNLANAFLSAASEYKKVNK